MAKNGVQMHAVLPDRLRRNFDHDFADQPQMMKLFVKLFGPYPLSTGYTVVVTDDDLEIPLEAQGISIFGANHCDGQRRRRAADRPRTGPPVVRQFGHRQAMAAHLAARGLRLLRRVAVVGALRRAHAPTSGRGITTSGWPIRRRTCCWPTPDRATCSTTGCTSAARSRCMCCGDTSATTISLRCFVIGRHATGTAPRSPTTSPGWRPTTRTSRCGRCGRRGCTRRELPALDAAVTRRGPGSGSRRRARSRARAWPGSARPPCCPRCAGTRCCIWPRATSNRRASRCSACSGARSVWSPARRSGCCRRPRGRCARPRYTEVVARARARIRCGWRRWSAWRPPR